MDWRFHLYARPILSGILLGLVILPLIFSIYKSLLKSLVMSFVIGLIFGFFLLFANFVHVWRIRKKYGSSPELLKCHHTRSLELLISYDEAFDLCVNAVKSLKRCKIKEANRNLGKIVAVKPTKVWLDWLFNQDLITIELSKIDSGKTGVKISSRLYPDPPTEYYVDYGSNFENVERIVDFLKRNVGWK